MVAPVQQARWQQLAWRGLKLLALCAVVAALAYQVLWHRDFLLFYWGKERVQRDLAAVQQQVMQATQLGWQLEHAQAGAETLWVLRREALAQTAAQNAKTVCLLGGVHGNEPAGTQTLLALLQEREPLPAFRLVVMPLANPWGWARDLRHNAQNQDIARQFVQGQVPESEAIKRVLQASRCHVLMDLHEDRFHSEVYGLAYAEPELRRVVDGLHAAAASAGLGVRVVGQQGIYAIDQKDFAGIRLTTAALWARQQGVPHALIVETPTRAAMPQRVALHRAVLEAWAQLP